MNKTLFLIALLMASLQAVEIPTAHAEKKSLSSVVTLNAKVIQLSNASQSLMSQVSGKISRYYVKEGQRITKGQKLVRIESIALSRMTATYIAQKKQLESLEENYQAVEGLYKKGMASTQELNAQTIKKDELLATLTALKSQLKTLGINTNTLRLANASLTLFAHDDGIVSKILQPLHSGVQEDMPILSLIKEQAYYLQSFVPLSYASKLKLGQKITLNINGKTLSSTLTQILPELDTKTQRIVVLSSINEQIKGLYINTYVEVKLYLSDSTKYVTVKKSALSFFNNEWVVFIAHEEEGHQEHDEHDEHEEHDEHGHEEHEEEEESPYEIRVVKIITQDDTHVAVEGIEEGEEYVSGKSYYVKSMLLKSSLGGHGH